MARGKAETKRGGALSFSKHMLHMQSHLQTFCDINKVSDDNENDSSTSARRQQLHSVGTKKPKSGFEILSWDTLVAIRKKKKICIYTYVSLIYIFDVWYIQIYVCDFSSSTFLYIWMLLCWTHLICSLYMKSLPFWLGKADLHNSHHLVLLLQLFLAFSWWQVEIGRKRNLFSSLFPKVSSWTNYKFYIL